MQHTVDFKECLKDSPKFRASLEDAEGDIEALEGRLERLVKQCNVMIDAGKAFSTASSGFVLGVRDLANYFGKDPLVSDDGKVAASLNRFAHSMSEMLKYLNILMDQAHRSVSKNLNSFIRVDIRKVKDTKKLFEKISDDMDSSLVRNSQAQRSKSQECEDANNALTAMRSCFAHTSLDYVFHINVLNSKKRFDILDTMLSFMHAQNTFFHQGHDLFQDLESTYMKDIAGQVEELSGKAKVEMKEMEERHTLVQQKDLSISSILQGNGDILNTEGYLFKRNSNAFKNYARRWFSITDSQLVYRKRSKDNLTVMEEDLRLCTIRPQPELDRRFCFEVLSPSRSHILQADSEEECQMWVQALNASISHAYKTANSGMDQMDRDHGKGTSTSPLSVGSTNASKDNQGQDSKQNKAKIRMEQLLAIPGNSRCCDCGLAEPRWASINLGCTLCIECSGIHRSFGVHMSKVRSITLDTWEPEQLKVMLELGNAVVNGIYEAAVDESIAVRAKPDSNRSIREGWIRAKYVDKAFVKKLPGVTRANKLSKWSVRKKTRRSPARGSGLQKTRSSSGSALSKTSSLPGSLPSSNGAGRSASEKNSPQSKDSSGEDSVLSRSGSAEENEGSLTSDLMAGGAAASKCSLESCPPSRAVMSVSDSMSTSGGGGGNGGSGGGTGSSIGDSGIADTTSFISDSVSPTTASDSHSTATRLVFGVDRPALLDGLNKSLDLESSDDSCQDFDDAEDSPSPGTGTTTGTGGSSRSGMTDRSSGVDCAAEDDLTTSWEDMSRLDPHLLLYKACGARNLPVMLQALANKADPNWVNLEDGGRTPIMRAVVTGSMATCEFLLLNNAKLDRKDRHGQTALHHATILGHTGQVCQLLKRRADLNAKDNQQRTPLMIAVDNANADIVTLLRLAKFDEEMKESDGYLANPADDTFQDVFRDFTNMASNNPEKLKRK